MPQSRDVSVEVERTDEVPQRLFCLTRAAEISVRLVEWIVRGHFEADTLAMIFGDPASGKSFAALDLACCVASGAEWHGQPVTAGPVIYIAGEGQNGFARRLGAWCIRNQLTADELDLYVSNGPALLCDPNFAAAVKDEAAASAGSPRLIVVDTVARNFGADENSTADMTAFISLTRLCYELLFHSTTELQHAPELR